MARKLDFKERDDRGEPPAVERILMVVSALFTVALFAFFLWRAIVVPAAAEPMAEVTGVEETTNGTRVSVELTNPGGVGLLSVEVVVTCGDPHPRLLFEMVPAGGRRAGLVSCPPDTGVPEARIASWVPA